jgi:hypothetical protein
MALGNQTDFSGVGNPTGGYNFVSHVNNNDPANNDDPVEYISVPETSDDATPDIVKNRATDSKEVVGWLELHTKRAGLPDSQEMTNFVLSSSAVTKWEERDVEMFVKGYSFCNGSRIIPNMKSSIAELQTEVRHLQRENSKSIDLQKSLAKQGQAVEMEIAAAVATIKADMIAALKSAVEGARVSVDPKGKMPIISSSDRLMSGVVPIVDVPSSSKPSREVSKEINVTIKSRKDKNLHELKKTFMGVVGIEQDIINVLTDDEVDELLSTNDYYEYNKQLGEEDVRAVWLEELNEKIDAMISD